MKKNTPFAQALAAALWLITTSPLAYAAADESAIPADADMDEPADTPAKEVAGKDMPADAVAPRAMKEDIAGSYLSSQFARSSGNIDQAIIHLRRVHKAEPENLNIAVQLQGMLLLQGQVDEAALLAEDIQRQQAKDPLADLVLTLRALKNGHPADAITILQSAHDQGNQQLWLPLLMGWIQLSQGQLAKPLTHDAFSAEIGRAAPLVDYHLALINARAGFINEATHDFKASIEDKNNAPPRIMQKMVQFYHAHNEPAELSDLVKAFEQDNDNDNPPAEIQTAADGIAEVLYTMGGIMFGAGVVNDAAIYMQLASYIKPEFAEAQVALGDAYGELQQYQRSIDAYDKVTPDNPLYVKSQLHIAVNEDRMGKLKEAVALLDKLDEQNPDDTDAIVTKGDLYRIHARYPEAVAAYTEALKRIPELESDDWPILFARGSCLERMGKWPQAEKDLQQALELKPDQPDILNYLGFAQLEHHENVAGARDMIARAVQARPDDPQIIDSMGWALYMQGEYEKGRTYLEKAVELLPSDATVNDHLGDVYWRLNRKTEARFQWNRALTYAPEPKQVTAINKKLKDGMPPPAVLAAPAPEADPDPAAVAATGPEAVAPAPESATP